MNEFSLTPELPGSWVCDYNTRVGGKQDESDTSIVTRTEGDGLRL